MRTTLAALALLLSAACAAERPALSVASPRPLREVMAEPGPVEPSSARQRLFASSAQAVESVQAAELAQAPESPGPPGRAAGSAARGARSVPDLGPHGARRSPGSRSE